MTMRRYKVSLLFLLLPIFLGSNLFSSSAVRILPDSYSASVVFPVVVNASGFVSSDYYAVEDRAPTGWSISNISHSGIYDAKTGKVKWGPFSDNASRSLSYDVTPSSGEYASKTFYGVISNNGNGSVISGSNIICTVASAPTDLEAITLSSTAISISWVDNANNETNYKVQRSYDGVTWVDYVVLPANVTNYGDSSLSPWMLKYYRVCAINQTTTSDFSNIVSVQAGPALNLPPPENLSALALGSSRIGLSWVDNSSDEIGFTLQRSNNGVSGWTSIASVSSGIHSYIDTGLSESQQWHYRVYSRYSTGNSACSSVASAYTDSVISGDTPVVATTMVNIPNGNGHPVVLNITPITGTVTYAVEEVIPDGWTVTNISDGGVFDSKTHKVKWGLFFDDAQRFLTYDLIAPFSAVELKSLTGTTVFRGDTASNTVETWGDRDLMPTMGTIGTVVSAVPAYYDNQSTLSVSIAATPNDSIITYALEEYIPAGWVVSNISHGGTFDLKTNKVKWGLFFDHDPRVFTFDVTPPVGATIDYEYDGRVSYDGQELGNGNYSTSLAAFNAWRESFLLSNPSADVDLTSDEDGDGMPLLVEYALGLDPVSSSVNPTITQILDSSGIDYVTINFRPVATDVTYDVQTSSDLLSWTSGGVVVFQEGNASTDAIVGVPVPGFLRLELSVPWD